MNTKIVKILAEIIRSLSEAERTLLFAELQPLPDWRETLKNMQALGDQISARHGGKPLEPSVDEIFVSMGEERTEQLMLSRRSREKTTHLICVMQNFIYATG